MEWQLMFLLIFGSLVILIVAGMPVAFAFIVVDIVYVVLLWGGGSGIEQFIINAFSSVATFRLLPLPLFILMGEVLYHSGIAPVIINVLDKWLGHLPGRLGLLAVGGGTLFGALSGSGIGSVALLGTALVPQMEKRGYKKSMILGPILGSCGLAIMIPPSGLAILVGAIGEISIGRILIGIIVPGLLMAALYTIYIIIRCWFQPSIAPPYEVTLPPLSEKLIATVKFILPLGFIVFLVVGIVFLGVATPSEAAATGTLGSFILAASYGKMNLQVVKRAITGTIDIMVMLFMLFVGAVVFSQIMSFIGVSHRLAEFATSLPVAPVAIIISIQVVGLVMGMFISQGPIVMICIPLFMPIVQALGFDPVWFGVVFLLNMEMATTSPPFGLSLFVMKGVASRNTTIEDCYRAALPFLGVDLIVMGLLITFPALVLWLPGLMR